MAGIELSPRFSWESSDKQDTDSAILGLRAQRRRQRTESLWTCVMEEVVLWELGEGELK